MSGATLGERVGDLGSLLASERRHALASYDVPDGLPLVRPKEVAARAAAMTSGTLAVTGCFGSAAALVCRELLQPGRRAIVIADGADAAERVVGDIQHLCRGANVLSFVHNDTSPYADQSPDRRSAQLRLATLSHLARGLPFDVLVAPAGALARRVVPHEVVNEHGELVMLNQDLDRDAFAYRLAAAGYARAGLVEDPGTFSARGSLVDVWSPAAARPVRIELLGDAVLAIKEFDPETQRTLGELPDAHFSLTREAPITLASVARARERMRALCDAVDMPTTKARTLIEDVASGRSFFGADGFLPAFVELASFSSYLPEGAPILLVDPPAIARAIKDELEHAEKDASIKGSVPRFSLETFFDDEERVALDLQKRNVVALHRTVTVGSAGSEGGLSRFMHATEDTPSLFTFDQSDLGRAIASKRALGKAEALEPLIDRIEHWHELGFQISIVARTETQSDRIATLLSHRRVATRFQVQGAEARPDNVVTIETGSLAHGIVVPSERLVLVTEEEIFGTRAARRAKRAEGRGNKGRARAFLEDLKSLVVGDFIVHVEHGVGRYLGLVHREVGATKVDLLVVEYAGGDKLYLPVYRLNQIEKFAGGEGSPKLDRLGGQSFAKTKVRAQREVRKMADELLKLYAERRSAERPALPSADDDYRAFEATFPYEETADQAGAIVEVERDLEKTSPMDRLVCGDVGFGKTEIAIRAAFRVASAGLQVAILCPTTVLAQQHWLSFTARMAGTPIEVRALSRFSEKAAQDDTLRGLKAGKVDIVIGTHRLLSKDVHFKSLGLLVVDEEQRFGVTHKERIKQLKTNIDVLTLSATPIPRTLQMAVTGVRDMSVITTPPVDRRAIRTIVTRNDPIVLRDAIERELDRSGQIFYVYNRVEGLHERAARIQELVPRARIAVIHGQMNEVALEQGMIDFVEGRYDVLCATAIIESGLDIPRANTIIIDRADMFGLAQLYQLRGRVGRSRERAYCYLIVPPQNELSDEARARIEAIERHTELGSGFQIASLDLELRGGGDLLGAEQSGTVGAIGFEMFCRMLEEAVQELRGEHVVHDIDPELSVDEEALLPDDYIEDVGVRLSLYKRLACSDSESEVDEIASEMEDRFGPPPEAAKRLTRLMRLKTELRKLKVLGCEATARSVTLHFREDTPLDISKVLALVQAKRSPFKLTPDMRLSRQIREGDPAKGGLEAADLVLSELARCWRSTDEAPS